MPNIQQPLGGISAALIPNATSQQTALEVSDVTIAYDEQITVDAVTASIQQGKITTIIGPNGAGKSTLLKAFARLLRVRSGKIAIMDEELSSLSQRELSQKIAMLLQQNLCPEDMTVERLLAMGRAPHKKWYEATNEQDIAVMRDAMALANIEGMAHKHMFQLSGGERQRVWLAMALAQQTEILLLDEPTTYLDIAYQIDMLECIQNINRTQKLTIVMVLHDLNQAFKYSDDILVLQAGKLIKRGEAKDIAQKDFLRSVYHIDAEILDVDGRPYMIARHLVEDSRGKELI